MTKNIPIRVLLLVVVILAASACYTGPHHILVPKTTIASTGVTLQQTAWNTRPSNEVAPGFEVTIKSAADPRINGTSRIDQEGLLKLNYDVRIATSGMTESDLASAINKAFSKVLRNPDVKMEITKREYFVDVQGLVKKAGQYLVKKDASLDELVSLAGGLETTPGATMPQYARIDQLGVSNVVKLRDYYSGKRDLVPQWQGGEVVFFQNERGSLAGGGRDYVQLLGQFKNPGEYPFTEGADFYDYMIQAGGPSEKADLYNLELVRSNGPQREIFQFASANYNEIPAVMPGDTIIMNADNPSRFEKDSRVIGGFTSIVTAIGTMVLLGLNI